MTERKPPTEGEIKEFIQELEVKNLGHRDDNLQLLDENIGQEIANKVSALSTRLYRWRNYHNLDDETFESILIQGRDVLLTMFPDRVDTLKDVWRDDPDLKDYFDLAFPDENEEN